MNYLEHSCFLPFGLFDFFDHPASCLVERGQIRLQIYRLDSRHPLLIMPGVWQIERNKTKNYCRSRLLTPDLARLKIWNGKNYSV